MSDDPKVASIDLHPPPIQWPVPEVPFVEFPKIFRLSRDIIVTEKIDGTNAQVLITDDGRIFAGSRNKWITPAQDNFGFAGWVDRNRDELLKLGPGSHFGEWWGNGIQRGYGLKEKRFSLFNTYRWTDSRPACCHVVPTLYAGPFDETAIKGALYRLEASGSVAAPDFRKPEGVVIFHVPSQFMFKKTIERDEEPKGKNR